MMFKTSVAKTKFTNTCFTVWILSAPRHGMALKTKQGQGQELVKAFQSILSSRRKSSKIQTDQVTEFLHDNNIVFFLVNSGLKTSAVERFNRTFKNKMYKYFAYKNTPCYTPTVGKILE